MALEPKNWREGAGLTLQEVARRAGLAGRNPARTYDRYEKGEQDCPAKVVEAVRRESNGEVGAEAWLKVRLAFLQRKENHEPQNA